jgi:carboxypeptidase family protein
MSCRMRLRMAAGLLAFSAFARAQPPAKPAACALHVHITDEDGTPLPNAFVFLHGEHGANQQFTPDKTGQVKAGLHSGMYDLFVSASGFNPQAQIVDLRTCKPVELNLMLTIDSEHSGSDGP